MVSSSLSYSRPVKYIKKTKKNKKKKLKIPNSRKKNKKTPIQYGGADSLETYYEGLFTTEEKKKLNRFIINDIYPNLSGTVMEGISSMGIPFKMTDPYGMDFSRDVGVDRVKDNEELMTKDKENYDSYFRKEMPNHILHINLHGYVFYEGQNYFRVPHNTIICILPDLDNISSLHCSNRIFTGSNKASVNLYNMIFDQLSTMSQGEPFEFKSIDAHHIDSNIPYWHCTNTFRESNWFFPGQICYDVALSANKVKYMEENLMVRNINLKKNLAGEEVIVVDKEKHDFSKHIRYQGKENMIYFNTLQNFVNEKFIGKRIIILESCQGINNLYKNNQRVENIKKFLFLQNHRNIFNAEINKSKSRESIKFLCFRNKTIQMSYPSLINPTMEESLVHGDLFVSKYNKKRRTLLEIKEQFTGSKTLSESYKKFILNLTFAEMMVLLNLFPDDENKDSFALSYINEEYFLRNKYIFTALIYNYIDGKDLYINNYETNKELILRRLRELGMLQKYLDASPIAKEYYSTLKSLIDIDTTKLLVDFSKGIGFELVPSFSQNYNLEEELEYIEKIEIHNFDTLEQESDEHFKYWLVRLGQTYIFKRIIDITIKNSVLSPNKSEKLKEFFDIYKHKYKCTFENLLIYYEEREKEFFKNLEFVNVIYLRDVCFKYINSINIPINLIHLKRLDISGVYHTPSFDESLPISVQITNKTLNKISLKDTSFSYVNINCENLKTLEIISSEEKDYFENLNIHCPRLQTLSLTYIGLSFNTFKFCFSSIQKLSLFFCEMTDDLNLASFIGLKNLEAHDVRGKEGQKIIGIDELFLTGVIEKINLINVDIEDLSPELRKKMNDYLPLFIMNKKINHSSFNLRIEEDDKIHPIQMLYDTKLRENEEQAADDELRTPGPAEREGVFTIKMPSNSYTELVLSSMRSNSGSSDGSWE